MFIFCGELKEKFLEIVHRIYFQSSYACQLPGTDRMILKLPMPMVLGRGQRLMGSVVAYVGRALSWASSLIDGLVDKWLMAWSADFRHHRVVTHRLTVHDGGELAEFRSLSRVGCLEKPVKVATSRSGWTAAAYSDNLPSSHNLRQEAHI